MGMNKNKKIYKGSTHYYSGIINTLQEPILIVDLDCHIVDANKSACIYLGREIEGLIGQDCCGLSHPFDRVFFEKGESCPCRLVLETKQQTRIIHEHRHDGKTIWEEILASPLKDKSGNINFVVLELRDITELVRLKEVAKKLDTETKTPRKFIPICASCKKIKKEEDKWEDVEHYINELSDVEFTHTVCPKCQRKLYPDQFEK
jgi:PAS domain S-box-containing protein